LSAIPEAVLEPAGEIDLFAVDASGVGAVTEAFAGLLGRPASDLSGRRVSELVHADDRADVDRALAGLAGDGPVEADSRFLQGDGGVVYVQWIARRAGDGQWAVSATDTADLVKLLAQRHDLRTRLELAIGQTTVAMWDLDGDTQELEWEPQAAAIFRVAADALPATPQALVDHVHEADRDGVAQAFATLSETGSTEVAMRVGHDHELRHLSLRGRMLADRRGAGRAVGLLLDVTAERALEEQLLRMSISDGLTGILNRRGFDQLLRAEWKRCERDGEPIGIVMVDVDWFKTFNDTHGHLVGDQALVSIARALKRAAGEHAPQLSRYGGEEFALVLPGCDAATAAGLAEVLRSAVHAVRLRQTPDWAFTVSVGVAGAGHEARDARSTDLLARADRALYAAKAGGRDRVVSD
jgi:diguanylate cyclase (GGDEF)-like protein